MSKRYIPVGNAPRTIPLGRIVVHNHVRPIGFPHVKAGEEGFSVWTDVQKPKEYAVEACNCRWAPHLKLHYRVRFRARLEGDS